MEPYVGEVIKPFTHDEDQDLEEGDELELNGLWYVVNEPGKGVTCIGTESSGMGVV
jgi:hypothetical protein